MKSIQTKFIILILGCVLSSSFVIGGAGILSSKKVADEDSARIMNLQCENNAEDINGLLSLIEQSVNTLAVYASEELTDVERLKTDPAYVSEYTKNIRSVAVNAANNTEGALAVYVRYNPEFTEPTSGLFWSRTALDNTFQQLTPTDFSRYSPDDVEHVGWYYIPVKSGKATWLEPYENKNINVEMISYVVPLYADNTTIGVVGMDIDFNVIKEIIASTKVYQSGYAFLTDEDANIMYHKELEKGTAMSGLETTLQPVAEELKNGGGINHLFPYSWRSEKKEMTFATLINGMRLAITAPASEINATKNTLILQMSIASVVIALLAVLLTIYMTRRLIKPLRELNTAAQKIAGGDLSVSLSYQTKDEVGTLADSFQQTVNHLRKYIDYINGLAYRDGLTGVKNKTAYQEAVSLLEEKSRTGKPEFAMVVLDINNLKTVNDTYGHDFGDMVIIEACKVICKVFKRSPVYRTGGDEFVVILENGDYDHYEELLDRFQMALDEFNEYARHDGKLSIARGIAVYDEYIDLSVDNVFKRADEAMYQNKMMMKRMQKEEAEAGLESAQESGAPDPY